MLGRRLAPTSQVIELCVLCEFHPPIPGDAFCERCLLKLAYRQLHQLPLHLWTRAHERGLVVVAYL